MKKNIIKILSCHKTMPFLMIVVATMALGAAFVAQYVFDLQPCILCLYQRWPFGIVIGLGLIGFVLSCKSKKAVSYTMGVIGLSFLVNSMIAFYHSGVERHWWKSFLEGCAVPGMSGNMEEILANIQSRTKAVRCDEIPWADPILHLSMANYNVIFCLGLAIIAFASARLIFQKVKS